MKSVEERRKRTPTISSVMACGCLQLDLHRCMPILYRWLPPERPIFSLTKITSSERNRCGMISARLVSLEINFLIQIIF
jgi:hypothetical protein